MSDFPEFRKLTEENCAFRIVSTRHLPELQREIESRREKGEFDEQFSREYMFRFKFTPPEELANATSLIIVAVPRPLTRAIFTWKGKQHTFILPPTYTIYDEKRIRVERLIAEAVEKNGYKTATPELPLKLLAVRSGLAKYGRNNIAYVSGMGSFMRLTAVYSDMPCKKDDWQKPQELDRCAECALCSKACPTGAISPDNFLLKAERCLTYYNEKKGNIPFPEWMKKPWHNCVVGCMLCQAACPENKQFLTRIGETVELDEAETKLLLKGASPTQISSSLMNKLKLLSIADYLYELPRNLSVLLE